jgi:hypothetical protein
MGEISLIDEKIGDFQNLCSASAAITLLALAINPAAHTQMISSL